MTSTAVLVLLVLTGVQLTFGAPSVEEPFKLIVLHNNDMHARFQQTNAQSGKCSHKLLTQNQCYGGFARVAHVVNQAKKNEKNVIFLNAGDTYQGTIWYTIHKWPVVAKFIQMIGLDAMSLGNHEFDDGVAGLVPFLENITVPVVGANLDLSLEPLLLPHIKPSIVLTVGSKQVGVIGYLTPETQEIAYPGKVIFNDEVSSIRQEARRLAGQGVDVLIAVGHSGIGMDQKIAREVEDIDLVIGGHTNTFLYSGEQPDSEVPVGLYPTLVTQASGRKVPVVTAYAYTKYLGRVEMTFDKNGEMTHYEGKPILMDRNIPQDPLVLAALQPWEARLADVAREEIGRTRVYLNGSQSACRMRECNLGNLITDAFIQYNAWLHVGQGSGWTDAAIAIQNGGGIRSSIDEKTNNGSVTLEDVLGVLPFQNGVVNLRLKGRYLREALEVSVAHYDLSGVEAPGKFLQYSGVQITYDLSKPAGQRIVEVKVRCADCRVPIYQPLRDSDTYGVLMSTFLADGGDGFGVIKEHAENRVILDATESDIVADFIRRKSPVSPGLENRVGLLNELTEAPGGAGATTRASFAAVLIALLLAALPRLA